MKIEKRVNIKNVTEQKLNKVSKRDYSYEQVDEEDFNEKNLLKVNFLNRNEQRI